MISIDNDFTLRVKSMLVALNIVVSVQYNEAEATHILKSAEQTARK